MVREEEEEKPTFQEVLKLIITQFLILLACLLLFRELIRITLVFLVHLARIILPSSTLSRTQHLLIYLLGSPPENFTPPPNHQIPHQPNDGSSPNTTFATSEEQNRYDADINLSYPENRNSSLIFNSSALFLPFLALLLLDIYLYVASEFRKSWRRHPPITPSTSSLTEDSAHITKLRRRLRDLRLENSSLKSDLMQIQWNNKIKGKINTIRK